jgi:hypothetical protein
VYILFPENRGGYASSRLYIAPEGHEATQLGFKQCSHKRGKYIIKVSCHVTGPKDPNIQKIEEDIKFQFDETFMMYLPRLCGI